MAITGIEYSLFRVLRGQNALPLNGDILELGEANWYGDVDVRVLAEDIRRFGPEGEQDALIARLNDVLQTRPKDAIFDIAKVFWRTFLHHRSITAIDFHGTDKALKLNLNGPIDLQRQFDVVMNIGTVEHVFNVARAFETIHDHALPGGLMIHGLPFTGWIDHGFYSFNPTFYWDLAATNGYEVVIAVYAELNPLRILHLQTREQVLEMAKSGQVGRNSLIYVVFRRPNEARPFTLPMQGYYANAISAEAADAWRTLR